MDVPNFPSPSEWKFVVPVTQIVDRTHGIAFGTYKILRSSQREPEFHVWVAVRFDLDRWEAARSEVLFRHIPTGNQFGVVVEDVLPLPDPMMVIDADSEEEVEEYLRGDPDSFYSEVLREFASETLLPLVDADPSKVFEISSETFERFKILGVSKEGEIIVVGERV